MDPHKSRAAYILNLSSQNKTHNSDDANKEGESGNKIKNK